MVRMCVLPLVPMLLAPLGAQEIGGGKEFLTDYEIDVLRDNQKPKERIAAYVKFASLRLELIDQLSAVEEAGRGAKLHRNLEEYSRIIEAVDTVIDDALARNLEMDKALDGLVGSEEKFLARLEKLRQAEPDDLWRYEFVLEDAIEMTRDSIEILAQDLGDRRRVVLQQDRAEQQRGEETMSASRKKDVDRDRAKQAAKEAEYKDKRPTLLRPGEKLGGQK